MQKLNRFRQLVVAISLIAFSRASGQQPSPTETETKRKEVVNLEPFLVTSSSDVGYGAQTASSSSRLNLRYIDVPQTVGVLTQELMKDTYVFDSQEFTKLVQHPDLAMPWPAWYELEGRLPATVALSVNGSVLPSFTSARLDFDSSIVRVLNASVWYNSN